jgi:hypothetical protein
LYRAVAGSSEIEIVHLDGVGAFVDSNQGVDHYLAAERDFDFIFRRNAKSGLKDRRWEVLSIAEDLDSGP